VNDPLRIDPQIPTMCTAGSSKTSQCESWCSSPSKPPSTSFHLASTSGGLFCTTQKNADGAKRRQSNKDISCKIFNKNRIIMHIFSIFVNCEVKLESFGGK
jgi:hypothetical protein